jgi:hypothetical protein
VGEALARNYGGKQSNDGVYILQAPTNEKSLNGGLIR